MRELANPLERAEDPREFEKQVEKPLECFMKKTGDQLYGSETSLAQAWDREEGQRQGVQVPCAEGRHRGSK